MADTQRPIATSGRAVRRKRCAIHASCGVLFFLTCVCGTLRSQPPEFSGEVSAELARMQLEIDALKTAMLSQQSLPIISESVVCNEPAAKEPSFPTARLTGFFQADAVWFSQSEANRNATVNGAPLGDVQDGADFRRARLAAVGKAWDNISYMLEMDFAFPGRPSFMDVWLDIDNVLGRNHLRVGQFRHPFGMDGQTSVKELTFLERGLPFAFLPFRQIGAMFYGTPADETATWAVSVFRFPTDVFGGNVGDDGGYSMASRLTGLLVNRGPGQGLVHLGGGYSYINPANNLLQYRNQPEIFVGETGGAVPSGVPGNVPPFVDTGLVQTNNINLLNAELALAYASFYAQSEAFFGMLDQIGGPGLTFSGGYAQMGYFLTGESRAYNSKNGVFTRVDPLCNVGKQGGIGAWELAARWSYLDLTDENILGGTLNDVTAGVNWYLNPYTKFQFNYIHAMLDNPFNGDSRADVMALRAQVVF